MSVSTRLHSYRQLAGQQAERYALDYLQAQGLVWIQSNYRSVYGEIDLILRDGAALIFVEVKQSRSFARAAESLSARQMQRIYRSAEEFLAGEPAGSLTEVRFDVALVDGQGATEIIENAFGHG